MKVVVVDDHSLFRKAVISILDHSTVVKSVLEASNDTDLTDILMTEDPDLIILDLELPEVSGLEICENLRNQNARQKILILTMYDSDELIAKLISLGVNGYLIKNAEPDELLHAIEILEKDEIYYSKRIVNIMRNLVLDNNRTERDLEAKITPKELKVLRMICKEQTSQEIADELNLSLRAVEKIRTSLIRKTNSRNVIGLIKFAYHHKLLVLGG